MPDYLTITCRLPAADEASLADALQGWPVLGCQVEDAGPQVDVTVYLEEGQTAALEDVIVGLRRLGASDIESGNFAEADWLAEYRRHVSPQAIGERLWIDPHPGAPTPAPAGRIHLVVEPRQAFGTGSHESTRLVLLVLEELDVRGARVLDVGTGSGILAIAARALGARWAVGFDIDLEAVFVARQTIAVQPAAQAVGLYAGPAEALRGRPAFDLILANMIPAQLVPVLPRLLPLLAPGGRLVVSGLLADQQTSVESELDRLGLIAERARELGEWVALVCARAGN